MPNSSPKMSLCDTKAYLGYFYKAIERLPIMYGHLSEHLTIYSDTCLLQAIYKSAVGQASLSRRRIYPSYP